MKWPRGKYNGQRIVGVSIKVALNVTDWLWVPWINIKHAGAFHWLCFRSWIVLEYESRRD